MQSPQLRRLLVVVVGVLLSLCRLAIARILTSGQLVCSLKLSSALSPSLQLRLSRPPSRLPVATNSSRSNSGLGSSLSLSRSRSLTRTLAELKTTHSEHTFQCCCLFSVHSLRSWSCLIQFYSKRNLRSFTRLLLATNRRQQKLLADNREESQSSSSELHSFASSISAFNLALCLLFGAGKL